MIVLTLFMCVCARFLFFVILICFLFLPFLSQLGANGIDMEGWTTGSSSKSKSQGTVTYSEVVPSKSKSMSKRIWTQGFVVMLVAILVANVGYFFGDEVMHFGDEMMNVTKVLYKMLQNHMFGEEV
jgi:hypothetical protein